MLRLMRVVASLTVAVLATTLVLVAIRIERPQTLTLAETFERIWRGLGAEVDFRTSSARRSDAARVMVDLDPGLSGMGRDGGLWLVRHEPDDTEVVGLAVQLHKNGSITDAGLMTALEPAAATSSIETFQAAVVAAQALPRPMQDYLAALAVRTAATNSQYLPWALSVFPEILAEGTRGQVALEVGKAILDNREEGLLESIVKLRWAIPSEARERLADEILAEEILQWLNPRTASRFAVLLVRSAETLNFRGVQVRTLEKKEGLYREAFALAPNDAIIGGNLAAVSKTLGLRDCDPSGFHRYNDLLDRAIQALPGNTWYRHVRGRSFWRHCRRWWYLY